MSALRGIRGRLEENKKLSRGLTIAVLLLVAIFPFTQGETSALLDASTTALAYVVMALGLNIVVGFAGLLDLGYVAFYAIGALTMGWLGSAFAFGAGDGKGIHVG